MDTKWTKTGTRRLICLPVKPTPDWLSEWIGCQLFWPRQAWRRTETRRDYYALHDRPLSPPADALALPSADNLAFHFERFSELEG